MSHASRTARLAAATAAVIAVAVPTVTACGSDESPDPGSPTNSSRPLPSESGFRSTSTPPNTP